MAEAENPREQNEIFIPENWQPPVLFRGQKAPWNQCWAPQAPLARVDMDEADSGTQAPATEPGAGQGLRVAERAHRAECPWPGQEPEARGSRCGLQQGAVCGHSGYRLPGPKQRVCTRLCGEARVRLGVGRPVCES